MASKRQELNEIKDLLNQIEAQYKLLGATSPFNNKNAKDFLGNIDVLTDSLREARDAVNELDDGAADVYRSWQAITNEVSKTNSSYNKGLSELSKITKISKDIKDYQNGLNDLSSKQIRQKQKQLETSRQELVIQKQSLEDQNKTLGNTARDLALKLKNETLINNITGALDKQNGLFQSQLQLTEDILNHQEKVERSMGVMGGVMRGISKIRMLNGLIDSEQILEHTQNQIKALPEGTSKWKMSLVGVSAITKNISSQFIDGILNPANLITSAMGLLGNAIRMIDKGAGEMAKSMNITYSEALNVRETLTGIANATYDTNINTKDLQESLLHVNSTLGIRANINSNDLVTMTKMREMAGFTNDETYGLYQSSVLNNQTLEKTNQSLLGSVRAYNAKNKLAINEKEIMKEVSKMAASLKLSLGNNAGKMAEAASQAKQFGINLQQASTISQGLLNFEQSIQEELSAELLLGKDLNFERARGLALNGDTAAASAEILKQVGTAKDFGNMNVIQQEAIAKAVGMTKDDLAKSLIDRENLSALSKLDAGLLKDATSAQDAYNKLKSAGYSEAQIQQELGKEGVANLYEQQSIQEEFNKAVEKLQDLFVGVANVLMPVFDVFSGIFSIMGYINGITDGWLGKVLALGVALKGITSIYSGISGFVLKTLGYQTQQVSTAGVQLGLGGKILTTLGFQGAAEAYKEARMKKQNIFTAIGAGLQKTILGSLVAQGFAMIKNIAKGAIVLAQSIATATANIASSAALSFGVGAAIGLAAGAAAYAYFSSIKDGEIDYSKGPVISTGYDQVQIDPKDAAFFNPEKGRVQVGTDLLGNKKGNNQTVVAQSKTDMNETNSLLKQLIIENKRNKTIEMDGRKLNNTTSMSSYRVN